MFSCDVDSGCIFVVVSLRESMTSYASRILVFSPQKKLSRKVLSFWLMFGKDQVNLVTVRITVGD